MAKEQLGRLLRRRSVGSRSWAEAQLAALLAATTACARSASSQLRDRLGSPSPRHARQLPEAALAAVPSERCRPLPPSAGLCAVKAAGSTYCSVERHRPQKVRGPLSPPLSGGSSAAALALAAGVAGICFSAQRQRGTSPALDANRAARAQAEHSPAAQAQSKRARWLSLVLVFIYVCCDISVYVVGDRASQGYVKQTVIMLNSMISIVIGSAIALRKRGKSGLLECFDPWNVLRLLPVSACFSASSLGLLLAFPHFDGAFIKLLGQVKLPLTALLSAAVLGRRYSTVQWQTILIIGVACTTFTALKLGGGVQVGSSSSVPALGLAAVLSWVIFNVLATLFAERAFKKTAGLPFATVMTNMRIGEVISLTAMLVFQVPDFRPKDFFLGWDGSTLAVLATLLGDAWLSALMVKRLSSVTKNVSKCCTLVALYSIALATGKQPFVLAQALAALMIVQGTALFAAVSLEGERKQGLSSSS